MLISATYGERLRLDGRCNSVAKTDSESSRVKSTCECGAAAGCLFSTLGIFFLLEGGATAATDADANRLDDRVFDLAMLLVLVQEVRSNRVDVNRIRCSNHVMCDDDDQQLMHGFDADAARTWHFFLWNKRDWIFLDHLSIAHHHHASQLPPYATKYYQLSIIVRAYPLCDSTRR